MKEVIIGDGSGLTVGFHLTFQTQSTDVMESKKNP